MQIDLNKDKRETYIIFKCKKQEGSVNIVYIDEDTGEILKQDIMMGLDLKSQEILPTEIEGYDIVDAIEQECPLFEFEKKEENIEIPNDPKSILEEMKKMKGEL